MKRNWKTIFKKAAVLCGVLIGNVVMVSNSVYAEGIREGEVEPPKGTLEKLADISSGVSYVLVGIVIVALVVFYIWWKRNRE